MVRLKALRWGLREENERDRRDESQIRWRDCRYTLIFPCERCSLGQKNTYSWDISV
jgi:hypothetical protein